ncbi:MAG: type II toxin-antitoxin system mRNA interferase toxin, RelE/StbE family [Chloroflexi bacterium]|nr:type II toxin-antitoxin system mRNA interferase toxin, RelE/StbE family [Chloroflexota bacterium]
MRRLVWEASFRRAFKQRTRRDPALQERILDVLDMLVENPFDPELKTHKLRGQLAGLWACWVEYDCRIVFVLSPDPPNEDAIVLADIGSHDEVY